VKCPIGAGLERLYVSGLQRLDPASELSGVSSSLEFFRTKTDSADPLTSPPFALSRKSPATRFIRATIRGPLNRASFAFGGSISHFGSP